MKIFYDTEFYEDGCTISLISIGMVREDGETYYAETKDAWRLSGRSEWLRENVRPHLQVPEHLRITREQIAKDILHFVGEKPEFWAYYADYDWVVLCQLYGRMIDLPQGWPMYCHDIKQVADDLGGVKLPEQGKGEHNALADARWNKMAYEWLRTYVNA
jgi:hypothetical protein